jgi:type I restriction enzyme S subunit
MRSNYKSLGNYVRQVNARNVGLSVTLLKGISINKEFMTSVANINGTDLSSYKIVRRGQFAFNPMHVGRDEVLPISLLQNKEEVIVSPAYTVFEIIDEKELLPEYLMMWCRRTEFDRNAWFTTDNSVRGGFSWDSFCEMQLPVPSIEEQKEIVKEYNTIINRIKLNEQLNQKLEETAQAIYKHWFVDFEFPDENGQPYKSSGGEMEWNEELKQDTPKGWRVKDLEDAVTIIRGASPRPIEEFMSNEGMPWVKISDASASFNKYITSTKECIIESGVSKSRKVNKGTLILSNSATPGIPKIMDIEACVHDGWLIFDDYKEVSREYIYYFLLHNRQDILTSSNGSVFQNLKTDILKSYKIIVPSTKILIRAQKIFENLDKNFHLLSYNNKVLKELLLIVLTRMVRNKVEYEIH